MSSPMSARPRRVVFAVLVAGTAALAAGCASAGTVRVADVETSLVAGFTEQVGGRFSADCPSPVPATQGFTFTCTVTDLDGGAAVAVDVVVEDADGRFSWQATTVTPPRR